jgi:hypothetical protein
MLIRSLLWGLGIAGTLTLVAFLLVLFFFDPFSTGGIGLTLFFVSLTATLFVALVFLSHRLRHLRSLRQYDGFVPAEDEASIFLISLRQSALFTFAAVALLLLQAFRVLSWWNILLVLLVPIVVESYARVKVE